LADHTSSATRKLGRCDRLTARGGQLGVDHIDTAYYYGRRRERLSGSLRPTADLVLVSKVGARRAKGEIFADDEPERLRSGIEDNLRTLGLERIAVVNLRLMKTQHLTRS